MSSTILMAIVLVVMWLVVLVPMFVRRHDDRAESRSMDRFATAMRVLSRRAPGSGGIASRRRYATTPPTSYADGTSPVRAAARTRMMRRRRRTLTVLVATAGTAAPLAMLVSGWLWLVQGLAVLLLVGYVAWLRQQVRREELRRMRRAALFGESAAPAERGHIPARRRSRAGSAGRFTRTAAEAGAGAAEDRSWQPVPVPTPTYVTAPVARRVAETVVDLDDDDMSFADLDPMGDVVDRPRAANE